MKYQQLLKDHKKLAKDAIRAIKTNQIMRNLIIDLADYMGLENINEIPIEEIIATAKERISL